LYRRFREEFESILFNELNFRAEARYTDMFRRRATKGRKDITAPRVYFQYCTEEVMVSELVSGVFMWELMAAVDSNDQQFLAKVRRQGIDPKTLASKLMRIMNREAQEELFFHADPHPANLIVLPDNKICFIDFGAIGRFSTKNRKLFREMAYHMAMGDIGRLANASISFLSPLPPRDVERIRKAMDKIYADAIFAMHSANAEWWEKIPAQGWLKFMEVGRQFSLPVSSDALLFIRTRFSYDVIIHRLSKDVDFTKEWQAYERERAQEVRSRVRKKIRQRLREPTDADYLQLEEAADVLNQFLFRFQRTIETPIIHFRNVVGKLSYIASLFLRLGYAAGVAIGIGLLADAVARRWFGREIDWASILEHATTSRWVQLALIAAMLVIIRKIMIRLSLPDTGLGSGRQ
jgi:ubiquinone biosynthesis protein